MRENLPRPLLLDTHIWLWLINGEERLKHPAFLKRIQGAAVTSSLRVSVISVWEVGILEVKGRIELPCGCLEWVHRALRAPGVALVPLTPEIAVESSRLPGVFQGDPADRILIATALSLGAALVTMDRQILSYAKNQHLLTLSV